MLFVLPPTYSLVGQQFVGTHLCTNRYLITVEILHMTTAVVRWSKYCTPAEAAPMVSLSGPTRLVINTGQNIA